jgi:hypothetical protein
MEETHSPETSTAFNALHDVISRKVVRFIYFIAPRLLVSYVWVCGCRSKEDVVSYKLRVR